jgi:hypothetical protein
VILPISASHVARIIGKSHQYPTGRDILIAAGLGSLQITEHRDSWRLACLERAGKLCALFQMTQFMHAFVPFVMPFIISL